MSFPPSRMRVVDLGKFGPRMEMGSIYPQRLLFSVIENRHGVNYVCTSRVVLEKAL